MSKVVRFHRTGGPEVLQLEEVTAREPQSGEVRIRTRALGLNRAEVMFRNGAYVALHNRGCSCGLKPPASSRLRAM